MAAKEIGRLEQVDLREVWAHEAYDLTRWLADGDNLDVLSQTIGVNLLDVQIEVSVGRYQVDILAEDEAGRRIIIENQLESSDHDHLGKLVTYAAGLDASVAVWVVKIAREEHEQAIHWLNENSPDDVGFFLIQLEAWKIGDSAPAPRFNIIAQPNNWAREVKQTSGGRAVTSMKLFQAEFFELVRELGLERASNVKSWAKALPQNWYTVAIGRSGVHVTLTLNSFANSVSAELTIMDDKPLFSKLRDESRALIEAELGYEMEWLELPAKKVSRIVRRRDGDIRDDSQREELALWLVDSADNLARVFQKYVLR